MLRKVFGDPTWFVRDDLRPLQRRLVVMLVLLGLTFVILFGRLWMLQVLQSERWRRAAENNRLRRIPLEAPRGTVTDIRGDILLDNRPTYQLLLFPEEMKDPARTEAFLVRIGIADPAEVSARIARARRTSHLPSVLADNLRWSQMAAVAAHQAELSELQIHPATRRYLPAGEIVAHLVGQLGEVSPEHLAANPKLRPGQLVGRSGIERAFEDVLGGVPGNLVVVVDALGKQVSSLNEEPPIPGFPLQVTIDLQLQMEAVEAMSGLVGAVVALDPRDGAVRVLLSRPAFDPDLFAGRLEPARWRALTEDPLKPLHNRALQALYPPGSTIKPIFAAGALQSHDRTTTDRAFCTGAVTIFGHPYRCWLAGGHGGVNLFSAIEVSCDTYFYRLAQDVGLARLAQWAQLFGLGRATGIEIPGESAGLVPSEEWSQRVRGHSWYGGETISVGIGQGPFLATPIQLAVAYAALVNGGFRVTPHLAVRHIRPPESIGVDAQALEAARRGMELVVGGERGTARRWGHLPVPFAGKTGTSQVVRKVEGRSWTELPRTQRHHALFVGYAPIEAPTLVVAVVVEHGGDASSVAAPVAARIFQKAFAPDFDTRGIVPFRPPSDLEPPQTAPPLLASLPPGGAGEPRMEREP